MEMTSGIVGRSAGICWTQRSPMFMYLNNVEVEGGSPRLGSIKSKALLEYFHNFHAYGITTQSRIVSVETRKDRYRNQRAINCDLHVPSRFKKKN
ncbi:hypothetical protein NC651_012335 [Populus alba x Populus x berolinensis]|nr:hypothetical protein NC651_012335 [Populus alba x Populus x berolinensis]